MHAYIIITSNTEGKITRIYYMASIRLDESCNLIVQFEGPNFAVMPSAAVPGHYEIFNALQNKTERNRVKTVDFCKNERRQTLI